MSPKRALQRCELIAGLGAIPPWWRLLARRRWIAAFRAIMAIDISDVAELLRQHYSPSDVQALAEREHPTLGALYSIASVRARKDSE